LKQELHTRLDLLRPGNATKVGEKQAAQKLDHDSHAKLREYKIGANVMARNYGSGPKWESAVVVERKGPLLYTVQLDSGVIWRRHIDQLRDGVSVTSQDEDDVPVGNSTPLESETPDQESPDRPGTANTEPAGMNNPTETLNSSGASGQNVARVEPEPEKRYPQQGSSTTPKVHVTVETELNLTVNNSDLFFCLFLYNFLS